MDLLVTSVRRLIWLLLLSAVGGATYAWWRDRQMAGDLAPSEWPPLTPQSETTATTARTLHEPAPAPSEASNADAATGVAATGVAATGDAASTTWVAPLDDGGCPDRYPIKANDNSGIFHVPGGRFYERTKAERCYASADDAAADGYRQSKS